MFVDFGSMPQENVSFQQLFEQGLASQQQKNWDVALDLYSKSLDQGRDMLSPNQASVVYHNMSVIFLEKQDFLKAYVWSKKALALNPSNKLAQTSFELISSKFSPPQVPHQISTYDNLKTFVKLGPQDLWLLSTIFLVAYTTAFFLKKLVLRKKMQLAQQTPTPYLLKLLGLIVLTVTIGLLTTVRWLEDQSPHAIIISDKAAVQTIPGENKPVIFEALAGTEVEVLQTQKDYTQVRYPGAFSGWIATKNIEVLSLGK